MNPLEILLMGSKELAALKISDMGQILIYVVYVAIILAFAGAFIRIYKEFGLAKIVKAIREGRDPVKDKSRAREKDQFETWVNDEIEEEDRNVVTLLRDKQYDEAGDAGGRADVLRKVLIKYREMSR